MNNQRYSSNEQEKHFQPTRVRVLLYRERPGRYTSSEIRYHVVRQDMITHEILETHETELVKAESIGLAKRLAQRLDLAFDLHSDVMDYYEAVEGSKQVCLLCHASPRRSHVPYVCDPCQAAYAAYLEQQRGKHVIQASGLLPYHQTQRTRQYIGDNALLALLGRLTGNPKMIGIFDYRKAKGRDGYFDPDDLRHDLNVESRDREHGGCYVIELSDRQAEAMRELIGEGGWFDRIMEASYQGGVRAGSNMLQALRNGTLPASEFDAKREIDQG